MKRTVILGFLFSFTLISNVVIADTLPSLTPPSTDNAQAAKPFILPKPPQLKAKGWLLVDADSGKILSQQNADERLAPASLTKMMTMYVISDALKKGRIHLDDTVTVSKKAYKMGGSKMFLKQGQRVAVKDLIQGIIVASGNDACVAMAEFVGGDEDAFVQLMNTKAKTLGMSSTHFADCTGMPNPDHYSTPRDLAILTRA